jgi:hypothetical protein
MQVQSTAGVVDQDFFRARAAGRDALRSGVAGGVTESGSGGMSEVTSATCEVPRARDATHSAIALNRAAAADQTEGGINVKKSACVQSGMWCETSKDSLFTGSQLPVHR